MSKDAATKTHAVNQSSEISSTFTLYSVQHREVELQMRYSFCVNHSHLAGCGAFHRDSNLLYETLLYLTSFARSHSVTQTALSQQELCHVYVLLCSFTALT